MPIFSVRRSCAGRFGMLGDCRIRLPHHLGRAESAALLAGERAKWPAVVKSSGAKVS